MKKITKKEIKSTIEQYNYICSTLRAMGQEKERTVSLNVITDYIIILKDERITNNQQNVKCYDLIYTICNELEEYENNNNFIDYYEEETATVVRNNYYKVLKEIAPITKKKSNFNVVFYLNDKILTKYDLINEFYGERESTIELLAYENNVNYDDIKVKIEEVAQ
jgi:hypothetical protein